MGSWVQRVGAVTLFVEDLAQARRFYQEVFELPVMYEDPNSAVFDFGGLLVNLLATTAVPELIEPAGLADPAAGARFQLTLNVPDVDAVCERLAARGVKLLNGPMDRPWGIRTAAFRDPAGHIWEVAG